MSAAFAYGLFASDSLPFPVNVGGQAAKDGSNHVFANGVTRADGKTVLGLSGAPPED